MSPYDTVVNLANPNTSQTLTALLVGEGKNVLDVGCATGYLADVLKARGCTVSGIENDPEAAEIARPRLDRLVVADLETTPLTEAFARSSFDRIVFADVLEHLRDPAEVLRSALGILAPDGEVIVSIPNVAHGSLRLALLEGRWRYTDRGLLDRTHLRFFTLESIVELLSSVGLVIREAWSTTVDLLASEVEVAPAALPDEIVEWVRFQPRALDYQFVLRAARGTPTGALPDVRQAVVAQDVRPDGDRPWRAGDVARQRSRPLTLEDQVIGLVARLQHTAEDPSVGAAGAGGPTREHQQFLAALQREGDEIMEALQRERAGLFAWLRSEKEDLRRSLHAERETSSRLQADRDQLRAALDATRASEKQLRSDLRKATRERDRIKSSRAYRLGRTLTAPLRAVRRRLPSTRPDPSRGPGAR